MQKTWKENPQRQLKAKKPENKNNPLK